jgi:hypothetical protein
MLAVPKAGKQQIQMLGVFVSISTFAVMLCQRTSDVMKEERETSGGEGLGFSGLFYMGGGGVFRA